MAGEISVSVRERTGPDAGRVHRLGLGEHVVGRDPRAAVQLRSTDVSRRHARLTVTADAVIVADLESKNGVRVIEGSRTTAIESPVRLGDEGVFEVGGIELVVSHPGAKVEQALARVGETTVTRIEGNWSRAATPGLLAPLVATAVFATVVVVLLWIG